MQHTTVVTGLILACLLGACSAAPEGDVLAHDPHERFNRQAHAVNKAIDRSIYGPVARGYGETVPADFREMVTDFSTNWKLPRQTAQYLMQGRPQLAAKAGTRFAVNTILGLGGLLDLASEMDLSYRETGFDEVFHVWGIPEGGYLEIPVGGPGTDRDWTGWALDLAFDPTWYVLPVAANNTLLGAATLDIVNDRYKLDPVLDELLYRSQDSYSAERLSYLQNKRAVLGGGTDVDQLEDVYADY